MRENPSYVFFRELTGPGPLGALGRAGDAARLGRRRSRASCRSARRCCSWTWTIRAANGLWVAQDTGGAIRGANRFDTFWGAGAEAAAIAGGMQARGRAYLLLPRGALERIRERARGSALRSRRSGAGWSRRVRPLHAAPPRPRPRRRRRCPRRSARAVPQAIGAGAAQVRTRHDARRRAGTGGWRAGWSSPTRRSTCTATASPPPTTGSTAAGAARSARAPGCCCWSPASRRPTRRGKRGAIRAAVGDWLAASRHAADIAAVRSAHPRHGGAGALYIILRRAPSADLITRA